MLISEEYRELQSKMHAMRRGYGGANANIYGGVILGLIEDYGATTVLDYGAGKGHVGEYLFTHGYKGNYQPYDPAIPFWSDEPKPADLVCCIDVLEHIEPEYLDNVLRDLQRVTVKHGIITVHHREAKKTLPDGRNAHLTVQPPEWWERRLEEYFTIEKMQPTLGKHDNELLTTIYFVEPLS